MTTAKKKGKLTKALTLDEVFEQMALTSSSTPSENKIVLTPISSEACSRTGINPDHLRKRDFESFKENDVEMEIKRLKYETYTMRREELMKIASEEKQKLLKKKACDQSVISEAASLTPSAILEKEAQAAATLLELGHFLLVLKQLDQFLLLPLLRLLESLLLQL